MFGREIAASLSYTEINKQLWRFEKAEDGNYIIINRSANRKLDISFDSDLSVVRAVLINGTGTASTNWKIVAKGSYFSIQAATPLADKASYRFAHQANNYNSRNYPVIMETTSWENSRDSYFSFVEFDDPNPVMSDDDSQTWYIIKSNKEGYEGKCVTDIVSSALPNIKFGIDDFKEGDYSQQWKLVKKTTTSSDKRFEMVNRATGNIIQTSYSMKDGYYYTQSTQDMAESNGWLINYYGEKEYDIYGTNEDGLKRYLNATLGEEVPEEYNANTVKGSGFSWTFQKAEVSTGWEYIAKPDDWNDIIVYSEDLRIYVKGADEYTVRTLTGVMVNKDSSLPAGVYLVTVNGKTKAVVNQ
ncbi:MAG: RICIN domain-containing protein [Bacteroidales bacterium]|nr:RICIN domain-containing protein [Bacteroidales bacterium]